MLAYRFKINNPSLKATIGGEIDCLVTNANETTVFDCKTGKPRTSDRVQVMVYTYGLSQQLAFLNKSLRGYVAYKDNTVEIPYLPETFEDNLKHFSNLLASDAALKMPGRDCQVCSITQLDCPERIDE